MLIKMRLCSSRFVQRHVAPPCRRAAPLSAQSKSVEGLKALKPQGAKPQALNAGDPLYTAASDYLKTIGFTNLAEISRVLDISTNPNSLFLGSAKNANARPLEVEKDIMPVVEFLRSRGVQVGDVYKIISGHPPVLSYTPDHLSKFWDYLASLGIEDVGAVVVRRPNLLGLDVDQNLRKMIDYLQYVETPPETIIKYLTESL